MNDPMIDDKTATAAITTLIAIGMLAVIAGVAALLQGASAW